MTAFYFVIIAFTLLMTWLQFIVIASILFSVASFHIKEVKSIKRHLRIMGDKEYSQPALDLLLNAEPPSSTNKLILLYVLDGIHVGVVFSFCLWWLNV